METAASGGHKQAKANGLAVVTCFVAMSSVELLVEEFKNEDPATFHLIFAVLHDNHLGQTALWERSSHADAYLHHS